MTAGSPIFGFPRSATQRYDPKMDRERKRLGWGFWFTLALSGIILLPGAYGAAYVGMVRPVEFGFCGGTIRTSPAYYSWPSGEQVRSPYHEYLWRCFVRAHLLDRKIRQNMWPPDSHPPWQHLTSGGGFSGSQGLPQTAHAREPQPAAIAR